MVRNCVSACETVLNAYWKDDGKTAEYTAEVIDRLLQLYLDEGN